MNRASELTRADFLKKLPAFFLNQFQQEQNESAAGKSSGGRRIPHLDIHRCLAWGQMECQFCYLACHLKEKAFEMRDHKPVIISSECDGCGVCVDACQTVNTTPALNMVSA